MKIYSVGVKLRIEHFFAGGWLFILYFSGNSVELDIPDINQFQVLFLFFLSKATARWWIKNILSKYLGWNSPGRRYSSKARDPSAAVWKFAIQSQEPKYSRKSRNPGKPPEENPPKWAENSRCWNLRGSCGCCTRWPELHD